jgi:acyl-coenzyme A thioesterase PaaI-like protein
MRELPHTHGCFVCGESNSSGLKLRFQTDGQKVSSKFIPRPEHIGFRGTVHGGIISTVLDEIMVWACAVPKGQFSYCAELNVRFASPLKPEQATLATAELTRDNRGRLFEASAELRTASGELIATATGKYLPINEEAIRGMLDDMVGDESGLFGAFGAPTST